jgi:tetratricopeptide (TPR) repeat protein
LHGLIISGRGPDAFPAGQALIEQGLAIAERAGLQLTAIRIARALAWNYLFDGRFDDARVRIEGVLADFERLGTEGKQRDIFLGALFMRDRIAFHSDEIEQALPAARRTYEAAIVHPNRTVQSGSSVTLALVHLTRGEYALAREWADRALEIARAIGSVSHLRSASALSILAHHELDEPTSADRHFEVLENPPLMGLETLDCQVICEALLTSGEIKRAEQCAERSYHNAGGRLRELGCAIALGAVLIRLGPARWTEAERWLDRAHTLAQAIGSRSGLAATTLARAELAQATGNAEAAIRHAEVARAAYAAIGFRRDHGRAERLLAEIRTPTQRSA